VPTRAQLDPVSEAATIHCDRQRAPRKLKRFNLGDGFTQQLAARSIRGLARVSIPRVSAAQVRIEHS
jgi:hypothetical protein